MATYNTAFGSLPTVNEQLFNNKSASAALGGPGGTSAPKTTAPSGYAGTFADLQKAGVARPAPQTTPPTLQENLAAQLGVPRMDFGGAPSAFSYNMLGELQSQLAGVGSPAPGFDDEFYDSGGTGSSDGSDAGRNRGGGGTGGGGGTQETFSTIPVSTLPVTTLPVTTLPVTTLPVTTLPVTTLPVTTLPVTTLPVTTLPVTTGSVVRVPVVTAGVSQFTPPVFTLPSTSAVTVNKTNIPTVGSGYTAPAALSGMPNLEAIRAALPVYEKYLGSEQAKKLRNSLEEQLGLLAGGPAEIQKQAYEAARKAKTDDLAAQYGAERSKLEEELAARGLSASTIGGGRYGDLAGQQARAIATFEAEIMQQQADAEAKNRQLYLSTMADLAELAGSQDLAEFETKQKGRQIEADISYRAAELQQKAALEGRSLDLQQARDRATAEYQRGQLQLGYAEIGSREEIAKANMTMEQNRLAITSGISMNELALRAAEIKENFRLRGIELDNKSLYDAAIRDIQQQNADENTRSNKATELVRTGQLKVEQATYLQNLARDIMSGAVPAANWRMLVTQAGMNPDELIRLGYIPPTR
jgi:hypothetical protein